MLVQVFVEIVGFLLFSHLSFLRQEHLRSNTSKSQRLNDFIFTKYAFSLLFFLWEVFLGVLKTINTIFFFFSFTFAVILIFFLRLYFCQIIGLETLWLVKTWLEMDLIFVEDIMLLGRSVTEAIKYTCH